MESLWKSYEALLLQAECLWMSQRNYATQEGFYTLTQRRMITYLKSSEKVNVKAKHDPVKSEILELQLHGDLQSFLKEKLACGPTKLSLLIHKVLHMKSSMQKGKKNMYTQPCYHGTTCIDTKFMKKDRIHWWNLYVQENGLKPFKNSFWKKKMRERKKQEKKMLRFYSSSKDKAPTSSLL